MPTHRGRWLMPTRMGGAGGGRRGEEGVWGNVVPPSGLCPPTPDKSEYTF
jgi:hypothetical protein